MNARVFLILTLGLALVAPACSGDAGAETAGQTIRTATTYNIRSYDARDRKPAKAWRGVDLQGAKIASRDFRGALTVVNFWASWCGPCRVEQPDFQRVWTEYEAKGVRVVGVTVRDPLANARAHVEEFGVTYPSVFTKNDNRIAHDFRVLFVPSTVLVDSSGRIAARIIGPTNERDLRRLIDGELSG